MTLQTETQAEGFTSCHGGYALIGLTAIAVVFGGFGVWAATAPLDSAAIASGRVSVESSTKPVQHLEGGLLSEVLIRETEKVEKGQVLFRLQSTRAKAEAEIIRKQLDAALATEARLLAEQAGAMSVVFFARASRPPTPSGDSQSHSGSTPPVCRSARAVIKPSCSAPGQTRAADGSDPRRRAPQDLLNGPV